MLIQQPEGIAWIRLKTETLHAIRKPHTGRPRPFLGGVDTTYTLCGRHRGPDVLDDKAVNAVEETLLCATCLKSLYVWGYMQDENGHIITPPVRPKTITIKNRQLTIAMFLTDIAKVLKEHDIPLTQENIKAAATHVETYSTATAKVLLQDTTHDEWLEWIETFKPKVGA